MSEKTTINSQSPARFTTKMFKKCSAASTEGTMRDCQNPIFLFSTIDKDMVVKIAKGEINAQDLARFNLASMGCDQNGNWIGFEEAAKELKKWVK